MILLCRQFQSVTGFALGTIGIFDLLLGNVWKKFLRQRKYSWQVYEKYLFVLPKIKCILF